MFQIKLQWQIIMFSNSKISDCKILSIETIVDKRETYLSFKMLILVSNLEEFIIYIVYQLMKLEVDMRIRIYFSFLYV